MGWASSFFQVLQRTNHTVDGLESGPSPNHPYFVQRREAVALYGVLHAFKPLEALLTDLYKPFFRVSRSSFFCAPTVYHIGLGTKTGTFR